MADTSEPRSNLPPTVSTGSKPVADQPKPVAQPKPASDATSQSTGQTFATQLTQPTAEPDTESEASTRVIHSSDSKIIITDKANEPDASPEDYGYYDAGSGERLTNFIAPLRVEEQVQDGTEIEKFLTFGLDGNKIAGELSMPISNLYRDQSLLAGIANVAGVEARIFCKAAVLRDAILEHAAQLPFLRRKLTRNFGWDDSHTVFRFPSGSIDRDGYHPPTDDDWRVDLGRSQFAARLDLAPPPANLEWWLRHIWEDTIGVNDRRVTLSLLGAVATAVLYPALKGVNRFGLWLAGKPGSGKSFTAQLFQNFFGHFPPGDGFIATWSSTANFLQAEGYYFKDVIYVLDDYKQELIDSGAMIVRLIQNYADGTARGRLKGSGSIAETRPIRGQLVSTGESVPDYTASAVSRLVVIRVPESAMDIERGGRCLEHCDGYSGVMSAFVHHLLAKGRMEQFAQRQAEAQAFFLDKVADLPNALRVAGNLGTLAAAVEEWGMFLIDAVPTALEEIMTFVHEDLLALRNELLRSSRDRHPEDTLLSVLADLVRTNRVYVQGLNSPGQRIVGKKMGPVIAISMPWCVEEINKELQSRGRPPLTTTQRQILDYLRDDGVLVDEAGTPIPPTGKAEPKVIRLDGKPTRCFLVLPQSLTM